MNGMAFFVPHVDAGTFGHSKSIAVLPHKRQKPGDALSEVYD